MAIGQGSLAGYARVAYEATGLADFKSDNTQAEASYRNSTRSMSDEAIRLELSQDKLRRSLQKGPAAYREQARAELQLRNSERALRGETDALARSQDRQHRSMGRLRGSLLAYGGAFLGGTGVLFAIKSSLAAAREEELVLGQTQVALEAAGLEWERYAKRIETVIKVQSALGFDDEQLLKTFQLFVRGTKDVDEALRLNALAADIARGRYMDLESAAKLVVKASLGQAGALRRVGIDAKNGATGVELITLLTEQYGQAAEKASKTGIAAQDRLNVAVENLKEALGRGLSPTVTEYTDKLTKWLDTAEHQEELQRRVNEAVETGEKVVKGLAAGLRIVKAAGEPVVDMLGGLEKAVELALIVGIVGSARRAAASFGLIAAASALTRTKVIADAAAMGAALDVATRPRAVPISVVGAGGFKGALPILGSNLAVATVAAVVISGGGGTQRGDRSSQYPLTWAAVLRASNGSATTEELAILKAEIGRYSLANAPDANMARAERRLRRLRGKTTPASLRGVDASDRASAESSGGSGGGSSRGTSGGRTIADITLDLARAGTTASKADDLRLHRELLARYQRQVDALERRKNLNAKQKELLRTLYGQLASEQAAIDAIISEGEQKLEDQRKKTREREKRQREAEDRAARQHAAEVARRLRQDPQTRRIGMQGMPAPKGGYPSAKTKSKDDGKGLTAADVNRMHFEFLSRLTGDIGAFGSNFAADGGAGQRTTQSLVQTGLLQGVRQDIGRLIEGAWHPGAQMASAELSAAGWGVGF